MGDLVTFMVGDRFPYPNPMGLTPLRLDLDLTD